MFITCGCLGKVPAVHDGAIFWQMIDYIMVMKLQIISLQRGWTVAVKLSVHASP